MYIYIYIYISMKSTPCVSLTSSLSRERALTLTRSIVPFHMLPSCK